MKLSEKTSQNIRKAHFVRVIAPEDYQTKYKNIFELLKHRMSEQPDDVFVVFYPDEGERIEQTYKQFGEMVFQTASLLKSKGIGAEDRIATVSHNHINTVIQYFACWCLGATVVPINVSEEPERIKYILESSHTKFAFVHANYLEKINSLKPEKMQIIQHGKNQNGFFEKEIENLSNKFSDNEIVNQETEALIVYTSGTTGLPKGVVLTQYNLMIDAGGISKWHKIEKGQTLMCVLPIHHVNGTIVTIMTPMYAGGRLILNQKFHTDKFFERLADENVQIVSVVPTLLQFLCHDFDSPLPVGEGQGVRSNNKLPSLQKFRHIICGAGPLTCELAVKFEKMFGLKIVHGYGLSETTCYSCYLPIDLSDAEHTSWLNDFGFPSIGVAIEPNEMDIQDDKGNSLGESERGEIVIRGHNVMKYYDENPEANDNTFEFSWFRSGDEGFFKFDSLNRKYFFITGRLKELIIRGGVNIAPLEIDEVLMSIPEIKAGIAVGFDNDWYGEEVGALVLLNAPFDSAQDDKSKLKENILKQCRAKLSYNKTPKVVVFSDSIPVTSTGKYQRNKVKHLFSKWKTEQFKQHK